MNDSPNPAILAFAKAVCEKVEALILKKKPVPRWLLDLIPDGVQAIAAARAKTEGGGDE